MGEEEAYCSQACQGDVIQPLASASGTCPAPRSSDPRRQEKGDSLTVQTSKYRKIGPLCSQAMPTPSPLLLLASETIHRKDNNLCEERR